MMTDQPDYHLDIDGLGDPAGKEATGLTLRGRPWVGIRFECCNAYARIYRNRDGTAYKGQCPHCLRRVTLRVGPDGTSSRFFTAE